MTYWWRNVPFSSGDKALIKNLYWFQKYCFQRTLAEFLKINCNGKKVRMLLTLIWETCSTNQRHETGRLKYTRTEEITVDEMVGLLNYKGQKQTYRSICQICKEKDLTKCSIVQIIHCIFGRKRFCLSTCLLSIIVSFSCICISQGSVVTQLMCGKIFNNRFIANCPQNASVKEFWKSVNFWWRYRQSQSGTFFGTQCSFSFRSPVQAI